MTPTNPTPEDGSLRATSTDTIFRFYQDRIASANSRIATLEEALREAKQRLVETYMPACAGQGQTDWDEEVEALMPKIDRALTPEGETK